MSRRTKASFDMQFITSSISTMLVLVLLGTVVFFVMAANNLSVYVRENIAFSILISDDMKEADILKSRPKPWAPTRLSSWAIIRLRHRLR